MAREWLRGRLPKLLLGIALVVVVGGFAIASTIQLSHLKHQLTEREQAIRTLMTQNDELQQQLAGAEGERKALEGRVETLRNQLGSASEELERLRSSVAELQARYSALEGEKTGLETQVSLLAKERNEYKERFSRLEEEKEDLERAAMRLKERLAFLDRDYQQLAARLSQVEQQQTTQASLPAPGAQPGQSATIPQPTSTTPQTVELPPIVVRKDQAGMGLPVRGRLVEVNETHRFVVIDKGIDDGVRVGMTFDILRGSGTIGQAVAVRVRPKLSACDIIPSRSPGSLQVGDLAIQSGP